MRPLALRRAFCWLVLLATSAAAVGLHARWAARLPHLTYLTGWLLLSTMLILTAYNARKKLPIIPLFSSRLWLQVHIYLGLFTGLVFLLHLNWRWPTGIFETILAALFVGVTLSGLVGWWISRVLPRRLTAAGGEVPFERIPVIRRDLRLQAEQLALEAVPAAGAVTLAQVYARDLANFFAQPGPFWPHLLGSPTARNRHLAILADADRFLGAAEKERANQLAELVRAKDSLDFHRANQLALKGWLFAHIPLTYGLLVFSAVHVVLIYAFAGTHP
jgi:hypothetical protein